MFSEQMLLIHKSGVDIREVHSLYRVLQNKLGNRVIEMQPAMDSIAVHFDSDTISHDDVIGDIKSINTTAEQQPDQTAHHTIPVCYELGEDLNSLSQALNLPVEEVIRRHSSTTYTVAMIGFLPGFLYLNGLPKALHYPRKSTPATEVAPGSVGIGGTQTGMYALPSPGGWHIIARSPLKLYPPESTLIQPGDLVTFQSVTLSEFEALQS